MVSVRSSANFFARHCGLTLVEAMIVLAIMSILLAMTLPSMRSFVIQNRLSAEVNQFIVAVSLARSEAVKRGRPVIICRSINADSGGDRCSKNVTVNRDAGDWGTGWLVMVGDTRQILLRQGALDDNTKVKAAGKKTITYITYNGTGNASATYANLEFSNNGEYARTVCIASSGRINLKKDRDQC